MSTFTYPDDFQTTNTPVFRPDPAALMVPLLIASALLISGCSKPAQKNEDIRSVRVIQIASDSGEISVEFPGEVRAKVESKLGFRVGGKIIARKVDVGSVVKRGQVLMQLDPQDFVLAQAQSKAALVAAESNRDLAKADLKRYQELRDKNFVSPAILESKETSFKAAQSTFEQAQAAAQSQSNQSSYAALSADVDGVVTSVEVEVGQVVAAGTPVVRLAQSGDLDVVVGIPEDKVNAIRQITDVRVRLWANPNEVFTGKLRELSPIADPVTRTYSAKVTLPASSAKQSDVKLGMTAYVSFVATTANVMPKVPLTALYHDKNTTYVWVLENGAVRLQNVVVGGTSGQDVLLAAGVNAGQTIVTAGVNLLKRGQKVKVLGNEVVAASNVTQSTLSPAGATK